MVRVITIGIPIILAAAGCASTQPVSDSDASAARPQLIGREPLGSDLYAETTGVRNHEVARYGRYTLVSTDATAAQRDLLDQLITVSIPAGMNPTVGEALDYVLERSGYQLAPAETASQRTLYSRPLPAAHRRLGPIKLADSLQIIAGDPWRLYVDRVDRTVSYRLRDQMRWVGDADPTPASPGKTFPLAAPPAKTTQPSLATRHALDVQPGIPAALAVAALLGDTPVNEHDQGRRPNASIASATAPEPSIPGSATKAPAAAAITMQSWHISPGTSLKSGLEAWGERAGWKIIWRVDFDYPIAAPVNFSGDFLSAVQQLVQAYRHAERPLYVDAHPSQLLIVVSPMGGNA